jgi:hypothetical protein
MLILSVVILSVVILSVVILSVVILSVIILSVIILSIIILSVVILSISHNNAYPQHLNSCGNFPSAGRRRVIQTHYRLSCTDQYQLPLKKGNNRLMLYYPPTLIGVHVYLKITVILTSCLF